MASLQELYKSVENSLAKTEIPPRPGILDHILLEIRQDEPDYRKLARMIGEDISLSASLIKTVNSPFFGLRRQVTAVQDALLLLGLEVASRMVAGILLRHAFPPHPDLEDFWECSIKMAWMSHWVTDHLGKAEGIRPADAYTFGLFRDCGIAVLIIKKTDYTKTLKAARESDTKSFTDVEMTAQGIHHAIVGARMAEEWRMPESIVRGILHHHAISPSTSHLDGLSPAGLRLITLSHLAEKLLHDRQKLPANHEWEKLGTVCLETLGISEEAFAEIQEASAGFINEQLPQLMF